MKLATNLSNKHQRFHRWHRHGIDRSLLKKHLVIEDIHNSWLYCFANPFKFGTRVSLSRRQPYVILRTDDSFTADDVKARHVSQVQEDS